MAVTTIERMVRIPAGRVWLEGELSVPADATGFVLFAHGAGSSRHSPRNMAVAARLREAGVGTLLFDLLTPEEDVAYETRFDIELLTERLESATEWARSDPDTAGSRLAYFGASTGAAGALVAAARMAGAVSAVVSRGGRPDLAGEALRRVKAPTLFIVGGHDDVVLLLNREAYAELGATEKRLEIVPGATHLFEEPGALEKVADLAAEWFGRYLGGM